MGGDSKVSVKQVYRVGSFTDIDGFHPINCVSFCAKGAL